MPEPSSPSSDAFEVAEQLSMSLDAAGCDYALGGAIALGFWAEPRGTVDVDVTLFMAPDQPATCVRQLQSIGCKLEAPKAIESLSEHGFCQVEYGGMRLDVFLPTTSFFEEARSRRQEVELGRKKVKIWDAETLCVFKMMFFRRKDLADVESILRLQGPKLDRDWVCSQLTQLYGSRDPRVAQWNELVREQP